MPEAQNISEQLAVVAKVAPRGRPAQKSKDDFHTAHACRAKAAYLREMAAQLSSPVYRANALKIAERWDIMAEECEA
jgi:hypothetical protein